MIVAVALRAKARSWIYASGISRLSHYGWGGYLGWRVLQVRGLLSRQGIKSRLAPDRVPDQFPPLHLHLKLLD